MKLHVKNFEHNLRPFQNLLEIPAAKLNHNRKRVSDRKTLITLSVVSGKKLNTHKLSLKLLISSPFTSLKQTEMCFLSSPEAGEKTGLSLCAFVPVCV